MSGEMWDVWHIKPPRKEGGKSFWQKVGIAFPNKDGSFNVIIEYLPTLHGAPTKDDFKFHIRPQSRRDDAGAQSHDQAPPQSNDYF